MLAKPNSPARLAREWSPSRGRLTHSRPLSCMEVAAMSSRIQFGCALLGLTLLLTAAGGCTDMVTFAGDNRQAGINAYNEARYTDAAGSFKSAIRQDPRDYLSH